MRWFIWHEAVRLQLAQALCTIVSHAWWFGRGSLQIVSYLYRVRHCSGSSSLFWEFVIVLGVRHCSYWVCYDSYYVRQCVFNVCRVVYWVCTECLEVVSIQLSTFCLDCGTQISINTNRYDKRIMSVGTSMNIVRMQHEHIVPTTIEYYP